MLLFICSFSMTISAQEDETLITNVLIVDGTGSEPYSGSILIQGDVITSELSTGLAAISFTADEVLTRLHFLLKGWDGQPIATGGHQLSFELVVQKPTD